MVTPNYDLPEITVGQRNKELTHNTAIRLLDGLLSGATDKDLTTPPTLTEGDVYIIPSGASGAWSGRTDDVAVAVNGAWEFLTPSTRWGPVWVRDEDSFYQYNGSAWESVAIGGGTFTGLVDTPNSYSGQSLKAVRVNSGETALEFVNFSSGGLTTERKTSSFTPAVNYRYLVLTSGTGISVTLPASPSLGDVIEFADNGNTSSTDGFADFALTINPNTGQNIQGNSSLVLDSGGQSVTLCYDGNNRWNITGGIV